MRIELYNKQINEIWELIQEKELLIEYIKILRMRLYKKYNIYWIMNYNNESKSHIEKNYKIKELFDWDSKNISFIDNLYYFKYKLPRDIYENYMNELYSSFNFVKVFVLIEIY